MKRKNGELLSDVSPSSVSHDSISRCFRPKDLWQTVEPSIDKTVPCLIIADDTVPAKTRSKCERAKIADSLKI